MSLLSVFVKYRALIDQLVMRDIKTKYRRSILGLLWTVLNPLLMMTVLSIVFSYFFQRYGEVENFPVYLLCGQVIFNFFNESTSIAMGSIVHSGELIKKVYVPKYLFPISKVMSSGVNLLASMIALVIVMVVTRSRVTPTILLALLPLLYVLLFSTGVSLFLSAAAVSFRDLMHLYSVLTTAWMYLTPVIYPMSILDDAPCLGAVHCRRQSADGLYQDLPRRGAGRGDAPGHPACAEPCLVRCRADRGLPGI